MIMIPYTGAYAGFLRGGGPNFKISGILDIHAAKRHAASSEAACREQRSCEPLLGGFGGMLPPENFLRWCNFVGFEGYFQPLSW